jgi:hypothetical protein
MPYQALNNIVYYTNVNLGGNIPVTEKRKKLIEWKLLGNLVINKLTYNNTYNSLNFFYYILCNQTTDWNILLIYTELCLLLVQESEELL